MPFGLGYPSGGGCGGRGWGSSRCVMVTRGRGKKVWERFSQDQQDGGNQIFFKMVLIYLSNRRWWGPVASIQGAQGVEERNLSFANRLNILLLFYLFHSANCLDSVLLYLSTLYNHGNPCFTRGYLFKIQNNSRKK